MTHLSKELVRFRRGLEEDLYNVQVGEPVFTTDTKRLFVGSDTGNVEIATKSYVDGVALGGVPVSWNIIVDKPTTFTPSTHFHLISDVTGLDDVLDGKANVSHFHTITNVSGLQDALDGKSNNGHTHVIGSIEGLESALNQRALSSHTHAISDVGGLQGVLDSKSPTTHGHALFSTTSDGFVPASGIANSTDFLRRDGTWATPPTAVASSLEWGNIVGDITNQADLQNQFATKASTSHTHTGVYEPVITAGTTAQYWRGDKTWQTLNSASVGLGNVDNTSDANKPISTATQTALNGKSDTTHTHAVFSTTANGFVPMTTTSNTTDFLRRDGTWATPPVGGGGTTWGTITGTLSAQTDLWNQFSTKADLINPSFSGDVSTSGNMNAVSFWENGVSLDSKYMSQISPSYTNSMTSVHDPSLNPNVHIIKPQTNLSWSMFANNSNGMGFVPSLSPNAEDWDTFNEILFNPGAIYISGNMVYHSGNLPSTSWGSISGTLSNQSDLQSALNAKFNATGGNITGNVVITKSSTGTELKINSGTDDKQIGLRTSATTTYLDSVNSAYSTFTKLTVRASALEYQVQPTTSVTETGVCGVGGQASTATNNIQLAGQMVNFKNKRTTTPASVTLTQLTAPTAVVQTPIQLHVDGFWLYVHTPASGTTAGTFYFWRGTYSV